MKVQFFQIMWHIWGKEKVHKWLWYGSLKKRGHLEDLDVDGRTVLTWIVRK